MQGAEHEDKRMRVDDKPLDLSDDMDDEEDLKLKKDNIKTHLDAENLACVQIEVMLKKALAEGKQAYSALQYSIRGQLNSGEGWSETGYDVEYAPRIRVASWRGATKRRLVAGILPFASSQTQNLFSTLTTESGFLLNRSAGAGS